MSDEPNPPAILTEAPAPEPPPPVHTLTGDIRRHDAFPSRLLGNQRDILVYLPPGYDSPPRRRYSVLYMNDGQNCFDAATSFTGVEWAIDETSQRLIPEKKIAPLIVVAVANAGEDRIHEYTPTRGVFEIFGKQGRSRALASRYGRFLVEELKPFIDAQYRTRPDAKHTGLGGSSLGGLVTLAVGLRFPETFTRLAVMSASIWWDDCAIYKIVDTLPRKPAHSRLWLDTGTAEPGWERAAVLRDRLVAKGWKLGRDLAYLEAEGAGHHEGAWAYRMESVLTFLFPAAPTRKSSLPRKTGGG